MKLVLILFLHVSMLLAMEKQIVLGSYEYEKNAKHCLNVLQERIDKNEKLQKLIETHKLSIQNVKIGKYTVVSMGYFNAHVPLFRTIEELQKTYADAYILDKDIQKKSTKPVEKLQIVEKAEVVVEEDEVIIEQEIKQEDKKNTQTNIKAEAKEEATTLDEAVDVQENVPPVKKKKLLKSKKSEKKGEYDSYYYAIAFIVILILLILIVATIIKRKVNGPKIEQE